MGENGLTFEMIDDVSVSEFDAIAFLRDILREWSHEFTAYAKQFSMAAAMVLSLSEASAFGVDTETEDCSSVMEYVLTEDNIANKAEVALEKLSMLEEDWDGYGSPAISRKAISNCHLIVSRLSNLSASAIEVLPTEYGGVQIKKQLPGGRFVSCDFGDDSMSYYIENVGKTEYFSFLPYSETNVQELSEILR